MPVRQERLLGTLEDVAEIESLGELTRYEVLLQEFGEYEDPVVLQAIEVKRQQVGDPMLVIAQYMVQLEELKKEVVTDAIVREVVVDVTKQPVRRSGKRYRFLKDSVDWSSTPQVHAVMEILKTRYKVGDLMEESDIVDLMDENVAVLATKQGGKRIWDYYKGKSDRGLLTHGNIEVA
jgi:hypothetical protein